jgi:hypothetical protein
MRNRYFRDVLCVIIGALFSLVVLQLLEPTPINQSGITTTSKIAEVAKHLADKDVFPEAPWRRPNTLSSKLLASTPFARFEVHTVRTESGAIIDDWLWYDERPHVNILVHMQDSNKFLLLNQTKYGLDGYYYAVVGGLFEKGESALECGKR